MGKDKGDKNGPQTGAEDKTTPAATQQGAPVVQTEPKSLAIAEKGIYTAVDYARLMSSMISDVITGRITPSVCNAASNAGGKLLKVVEMQAKYGTKGDGQRKTLTLVPEENEASVH